MVWANRSTRSVAGGESVGRREEIPDMSKLAGTRVQGRRRGHENVISGRQWKSKTSIRQDKNMGMRITFR